ncbi:MAG TPA: PQ-loop domain-containing transporter [Microlunatus sp.]|nr:PQ-loop domain-containing transporter [Microlunatus sp.]
MLVVTLGWIAAALASFVAVPQVVKLLRTRTTAGLSLTAWRLTLAANIAWMSHGIVVGHANIWLPNLIFMLCSLTILNQLRRDRALSWSVTFGPSLVLGLTTLSVDVLYRPVAFAIAAGLPSVTSQILQFHELVLTPRISAVSLPFLALNTVNQALWLGWGLLAGEQSITMVASAMGMLMGINLVWCVLRRTGVVRARLAVLSA